LEKKKKERYDTCICILTMPKIIAMRERRLRNNAFA